MRLRPASHLSSVCTVPSSHAKESGAVGSSWYVWPNSSHAPSTSVTWLGVRVRVRVRVKVRARARARVRVRVRVRARARVRVRVTVRVRASHRSLTAGEESGSMPSRPSA